MTGVVWSRRAIRDQRDINEQVRATQGQRSSVALNDSLALLVKTVEPISAGSSGFCELLEGELGSVLRGTGIHQLMWNLASDCNLDAGVECLATRLGVPGSGNGGWIIQRCQEKTDLVNTDVYCPGCTNDLGPEMYQVDFTTCTAGGNDPSPDDEDLARYLLNAENLFLKFRGENQFGFCEWSSDSIVIPTTTGLQLNNPNFFFTVGMSWNVATQNTSYFELTITRNEGILFGRQKYLDTGILDTTAQDCLNASRAITLDVSEVGNLGGYLTANPVLNLLYNG